MTATTLPRLTNPTPVAPDTMIDLDADLRRDCAAIERLSHAFKRTHLR